jgi:hypothetical protein
METYGSEDANGMSYEEDVTWHCAKIRLKMKKLTEKIKAKA